MIQPVAQRSLKPYGHLAHRIILYPNARDKTQDTRLPSSLTRTAVPRPLRPPVPFAIGVPRLRATQEPALPSSGHPPPVRETLFAPPRSRCTVTQSADGYGISHHQDQIPCTATICNVPKLPYGFLIYRDRNTSASCHFSLGFLVCGSGRYGLTQNRELSALLNLDPSAPDGRTPGVLRSTASHRVSP